MSRYYNRFPEYVPVAQKKAEARRNLDTLKKKDPGMQPVTIEGSVIAKSWWGKAWNANLEKYADFANRIGRGKSYLRYGAVLDLRVDRGCVTALVQGSRSKPYKVKIDIRPLSKKQKAHIIRECASRIGSLSDLLKGKFPKDLAEIFTQKGNGLFPAPKEIAFDCSCPDWASMCKHVAAVLFGIGARLDDDPSLFFTLRDMDMQSLVSEAIADKSDEMIRQSSKVRSSRIIEGADLSALFGIELSEGKKKRGKSVTPDRQT